MVFESLFDWREIEKSPWKMIFLVVVLTLFSIGFASYIFPSSASVVFIAFLSMSLMPVMYNIFVYEEEVDEEEYETKSFFERHGRVLRIYTYIFVGVIFGVIIFGSFIDDGFYSKVFSEQIKTLESIRGEEMSLSTGNFVNEFGVFTEILVNNLQVSVLAFVLSFVFGSGALFLISWNASVLGVFSHMMADKSSAFYVGHVVSLLSISLHGIPEMFAYFIAGLGGAILSIGMLKGKNRYIILKDSMNMFIISVLFVLVGGILEVFVTPYI